MEAQTIPASDVSTGSSTIADLFAIATARNADGTAFKFKRDGAWVDQTYAGLGETVKELSLGLIALGIKPGDRVSILANTRPEWSYFDYAALCAGAIVVPIYQTNSPEECEYVLDNAEVSTLIVEDDEQLEKIRKVRANLPLLEHVIVMDDERRDDAISTAELRERGAAAEAAEFDRRVEGVDASDICTIIYTSGTTGPPKGCVITHGNYRQMLNMIEVDALVQTGEVAYLYLPLAHSFARLIAFLTVDVGAVLAFFESIDKIVPDLAEVKPTFFPSVPRIFEKIYTLATSAVEKAPPEDRERFWKAIEIGQRVQELRQQGLEPEGELAEHYAEADERIFKNVRGLFGGNLKYAITGAAPIAREILEFFWACGVLVLEGWGMTETSTAASCNTPDAFRFGTVGKALPGCEVRIAGDGEIIVRGANIFQGYWKNEQATGETLAEGWLHTGDLGEIDQDGFIKITGRKKDIIITAGGKNITPANLENSLKQNQYISQAVVHGDRRPYLTGVVTLDHEEMVKWAGENGIDDTDPESLAKNPKVLKLIQVAFDRVNEKFARVEQVKKFTILPQDFAQETGELTPSLKVKRSVVYDKYADVFDAMYQG